MARHRLEEDKEISSNQMSLNTLNKRVARRATYLACAVFLALLFIILLIVFLSNNNIISFTVSSTFVIESISLAALAGFVIGFTYYVADAWFTL